MSRENSLARRIDELVTNQVGYRDSHPSPLLLKDSICKNTYIDLQRKLLHLEYKTHKITLIEATQFEDKLVEFKKDIGANADGLSFIKAKINSPVKLYAFVEIPENYIQKITEN